MSELTDLRFQKQVVGESEAWTTRAERYRKRTVPEYIDEIASMPADAEYKDKDSALQWLLYLAWSDLKDAQRSAMDGSWSIQCESEVRKIVNVTRLVGPISWDQVPCDFVGSSILAGQPAVWIVRRA